jgi:hypothetical protein
MMADGAFDQAAIDLMVAAYEKACKELHLTDSPYAAANEAVAAAIIEFVREGERDAVELVNRVVQRVQRPAAE